jgi:AcrR family transcriptional regulator
MSPRRRQQERTRVTQRALIAAARPLFAERGYAAVSAEEIVAAAGLTRGALRHHFGDKKALFRAVFE